MSAVSCSFCLSKDDKTFVHVNKLQLEDNVSFIKVLGNLLPEVDLSKDMYTCEECLISFWSFYTFKQKIQVNISHKVDDGREIQKIETTEGSSTRERKHRIDYSDMMEDKNDVDEDYVDQDLKVPIIKESNHRSQPDERQQNHQIKVKKEASKTLRLKEMISLSKISADTYNCIQCKKVLSGFRGIRYHIKSQHIDVRDPSKVWVRNNILEGRKLHQQPNGVSVYTFKCVICSKDYNNEPGLRYHLTKHLKDDLEN